MKIFKIKDKVKINEIFSDKLFYKNGHSDIFRIIYKNKIYLSHKDKSISKNEIDFSKVKLISFSNIIGINNKTKKEEILNKLDESHKYKNNTNKYNIYLRCSLNLFREISYNIFRLFKKYSRFRAFSK